MKNYFYLLNLKVCGIKNIEEEISIDFYKRTIAKDFSPYGYNVKAIYGENGSGKTAIVTAVNLLVNLLTDEDYLSSPVNQKNLDAIVNKRSNTFSCTCEILDKTSDKLNVYKYSIVLTKGNSGKYVIANESLSIKSRTGKAYTSIFECINGEIKYIKCEPESEKIIRGKSANVLNTRTLVMNIFLNKRDIGDEVFLFHSLLMFSFGLSIYTYLDTNDQHDLYFLSKSFREMQNDNNQAEKLIFDLLSNIDRFIGVGDRRIPIEEFEKYEAKVKKLEHFLKLFKTELKSITIDRKDNRDYYECSLVLNYDGYSIDKEFESTGIKRLINLFDYFNYAADGQIVFIDEMDANINDIYLCRLVEYFMEYGEGQLCFTTHNTSPMGILRENKMSIDFLSNDNRIIPWKTNGHYSPESLYRSGMIQYLPFNVDTVDFIGILGGRDE